MQSFGAVERYKKGFARLCCGQVNDGGCQLRVPSVPPRPGDNFLHGAQDTLCLCGGPVGRLGTLRALVGVVTPLNGGSERINAFGDQHAQANRTRQKSLLGRSAIDLGAVIASRLLSRAVDFVLDSSIFSFLVNRQGRWSEVAGEVPTPRRLRQKFVCECVVVRRPDEVEPQCLEEVGTNLVGSCGGG